MIIVGQQPGRRIRVPSVPDPAFILDFREAVFDHAVATAKIGRFVGIS
jgi:hypothetical protein